MSGIFGSWEEAATAALKNLEKGERVYSASAALALVDYLSSRKVHFESDVRQYAADTLNQTQVKDFVSTTLGHVTTAVHGGGAVPDAGGWYFHDQRTDSYVLNREFAVAWREVRKL